MPKRNALLIPAFLCILAALACLGLKTVWHKVSLNDQAPAENKVNIVPLREIGSDQFQQTKRGRQDNADAKVLRELEAEFDGIIPAQFPEQPSSLCDATLNPGETLVLGGLRAADGNYEFTTLQAVPLNADGSPFDPGEPKGTPLLFRVNGKILSMSTEAASELGFGSLISPAKTRIQKSVLLPPGESPRQDVISRILTMPSATLRQDTAASISVGTEKQAYVISLIVSPQDAGESLRIRTRVESPTGYLPLR